MDEDKPTRELTQQEISDIEFKELPGWIKIILSILGAISIMFSIFMPIAISLMLVKFYTLSEISQSIVIMLGCITTLYKAIDVVGIDTIEYVYNKLIFKRD